MVTIEQGLRDEGVVVSMVKLCRWFEVPRSTAYYRTVKSASKVRPELAAPIKQLIEAEPSFGCRTVAGLLGRLGIDVLQVPLL
jgi:putative transposase